MTQTPTTNVVHTDHTVETLSGLNDLADAFQTLRSSEEVARFLRDLCTLPELEALAHRWQTARLVDQGVPYLEVAARVPTSTATVTRVAQWLRHGTGGYRLALERVPPVASKDSA
jgi:TrpR-related protein YerC/YecD